MCDSDEKMGIETKAIQKGRDIDPKWYPTIMVPPIVNSMTFYQFDPANIDDHCTYSRLNNPTRESLEKCLASLDNAEHALVYPSGSAAIFGLLHLLRPGDHFISCTEQYGGSRTLFLDYAEAQSLTVDFVDSADIELVEAAIKSNTKMIYVESPSNPNSRISDIAAISELIHSRDDSEIIFVVDNTLLTPYFQRPLELGATIVVYSITKYMNGHNDVLAGSIALNDSSLFETLKTNQVYSGSILSPFDSFLTLRGLRTLVPRMKLHFENGLAVARYLESHPKVLKVHHPWLQSHPQHELAKKQSSGHSGLLSIHLEGTIIEAKKFILNLKIFQSCISLGGFSSFAAIPVAKTQASIPEEIREKLGIYESSIRLSVGLENADDLIHDLEQALKRTYEAYEVESN